MGRIKKLSCECGYEKSFALGTGNRLPDAAYINENFSMDKLADFNAGLQSGSLGRIFYIANTLSYCGVCKELKEGKKLHYKINEIDKTVSENCDTCHSELTQTTDGEILCPSCGKVLHEEMDGFWD